LIVPDLAKLAFNFAPNTKKREVINCRKYRRVIISVAFHLKLIPHKIPFSLSAFQKQSVPPFSDI
jgi:hypothetical protein